jgi:hypothetical protein
VCVHRSLCECHTDDETREITGWIVGPSTLTQPRQAVFRGCRLRDNRGAPKSCESRWPTSDRTLAEARPGRGVEHFGHPSWVASRRLPPRRAPCGGPAGRARARAAPSPGPMMFACIRGSLGELERPDPERSDCQAEKRSRDPGSGRVPLNDVESPQRKLRGSTNADGRAARDAKCRRADRVGSQAKHDAVGARGVRVDRETA